MKKFSFLILMLVPFILNAQVTDYKLSGGISKTSAESPKSNSILDIVMVGDTIILGTSRGLSTSADGGNVWKNYYGLKPFGNETVIAIAYKNGVLWASLGHSEEINGSNLPKGTGLVYSKDFGETWTLLPQPVDNSNDSSIVYGINNLRALPVTTQVNNITYDIALTSNEIWIASFAGGLRKSGDFGETWERVVLPADYLDSISPNDTLNFSLQPVEGAFGNESYLNHRLFSVLAATDSLIYAGSAGGINQSTDGGVSWQKFNAANQSKSISGNFVTSLGYDYASKSIWASTWRAEGVDENYGVSASFDFGETWEVFLPGQKAHNFGFLNYGTESDVFVTTDDGIFRSIDYGFSWIKPGLIKDDVTQLTLQTNVFYSAAAQIKSGISDIWLGSNEGLINLKETNLLWEGEWKIYVAGEKISGAIETYAYPNPFAPGLESLKIKYSTKGKSEKVSIRIFDFGMNLIKTLLANANRSGSFDQIEYWDGLDDNNQFVPNGVYFYRIDIGNNDPVFSKVMVLR